MEVKEQLAYLRAYADGYRDAAMAYTKILHNIIDPKSREERSYIWVNCTCDPEYSHHCLKCGGGGTVKECK